jgi:hypothetical protein
MPTVPDFHRLSAASIHEAELASGPSGAVLWGSEIDFAEAVVRRRAGSNVVVRGDETKSNRALARQIEETVGVYVRSAPHTLHAGPDALPHFQQADADHEGHWFYETPNRRARKKS